MLTAPKHLTGDVLAHFKRVAKALDKRVEEHHLDAIVRYVECCAATRKVMKLYQSLEPDTEKERREFLAVLDGLRGCVKLERELAAELGLSPASEATKKMDKLSSIDEKDQFASMNKRMKNIHERKGK